MLCRWLGLRPSDFDRYELPEQCRLPMSDKDIKTGEDLLKVQGFGSIDLQPLPLPAMRNLLY